MIYKYLCPLCEISTEITKPIVEVERIEHCHICESELQRVWEAPMISTADGVKQ